MKFNYLIRLTIFTIIFSLNAQEPQDKKTVKYTEKWTKVDGVAKYRLEIYDLDNKPVRTIETEKNEVEIELFPGKYKKRLGLINPFNQIFLYTDWKDFEVMEIPLPQIIYIENKPLKSEKPEEILISVNGIVETTKIYLRDKNNQMIPVNFKQIDTNRIALQINPQLLSSEKYNLVIKNSEKKLTELPDAIQLQKTTFDIVKIKWKYLIPGLPQKERKQYTKGNILQWGFIGSLLTTGYFYNQALTYQKQYDNLILTQYTSNNTFFFVSPQFFKSSNGILFLYQQSFQINQTARKYQLNINTFYYALGLTTLFYSYHMIDVYYYDFYLNSSKNELKFMITIPF